jgi:hypothetical protein
MIPTVAQQIGAVRSTIAKNILPALDPDDSFAAEQVGLVLACLDWTLDVQGSEYRYELVEHGDYRDLLGVLVDIAPAPDAEQDRALLAATAGAPGDLASLRDRTRALKDMVEHRYGLLADSTPAVAEQARREMAVVAERQCDRELAWCRMTGFPRGVQEGVAQVLDRQSAGR